MISIFVMIYPFSDFSHCLIGPRPDGYNKLMQYYDASPTRQIRRDKYTIIRSAILEKLTPLFKFHLKDRRYALKEDHSLVCLPIFDGKYQFYRSLFAWTMCHFKSFVDFTDAWTLSMEMENLKNCMLKHGLGDESCIPDWQSDQLPIFQNILLGSRYLLPPWHANHWLVTFVVHI